MRAQRLVRSRDSNRSPTAVFENQPVDSALVSVADNGGSSGRLTPFGVPPPGDIRRCLLALTPDPSLWSELFAHRFTDGDISDHSLGNLILVALTIVGVLLR